MRVREWVTVCVVRRRFCMMSDVVEGKRGVAGDAAGDVVQDRGAEVNSMLVVAAGDCRQG